MEVVELIKLTLGKLNTKLRITATTFFIGRYQSKFRMPLKYYEKFINSNE